MSVSAYLGLGSNLGDRAATLRSALAALGRVEGLRVTAVSTFVETAPVGPPGQGAYLNAAAAVSTTLEPRGLLEACLAIERAHGRVREPQSRWGPRTLDVDILLVADRVIDEPGLVVPHPKLHERTFVLVPLAEIAGKVRHPVLGRSIESLREAVGSGGVSPGSTGTDRWHGSHA